MSTRIRLKPGQVCINLYLLALYTTGTISAMTESWIITIFLLLSAIVAISISPNNCNRYRGTRSISLAWFIMTTVCLLGSLRGVVEVLVYFYVLCSFFMLFSCRLNEADMLKSLNILRLFGILFAVGCYWQSLFPNQYYTLLYPRFGSFYQQSIARQFTYHKMCTGFTSQTTIAAIFIVLGLMAEIYYCKYAKKSRLIRFVEICFLFGGLLLTGKRSPLLTVATSFTFVNLLMVRKKERGRRLLRIIAVVCIMSLIAIVVAPHVINPESRTSIVRLLEFNTDGANTYTQEDGDFSNGRVYLYMAAMKEFMDNPLFGIGWGRFSAKYGITGVHNIYLQLLCECGIIGAVIVISALLFILSSSIRLLKQAKSRQNNLSVILLKCSIFLQTYVLGYGLFDNPIYDQTYLLTYFYALLLIMGLKVKEKNNHHDRLLYETYG